MSKRRLDKTTSLANAIRECVHDGDQVAMGLCLESLIPFAAGHELVRQGKKALTLVGPISDILFDELIGAGCVQKVIAAWVGNVGAGMGYNFRRAVERGDTTAVATARTLELYDYPCPKSCSPRSAFSPNPHRSRRGHHQESRGLWFSGVSIHWRATDGSKGSRSRPHYSPCAES